jgi:phosphomannomutase
MGSIFKAYDIRGEYGRGVTEDVARRVGNAFAVFIGSGPIVLGRDIRLSSPSLAAAAEEGIRDAGQEVIRIGDVTTPMAYFATGYLRAAGGMMVTASHNPGKDNGFKLCRDEAKPIGQDTGLLEVQDLVEAGSYRRGEAPGGVRDEDVRQRYIDHVLSFGKEIGALRVVMDTANGTVGIPLPGILDGLPSLDCTTLFLEPDGRFPNHEPNPLKPKNIVSLRETVLEKKADLGIAFDGDGDRCAVLDEKGEVVGGDLLTALIAMEVLEHHPGASIVYDQRSSLVVKEEIEKAGGKAVPERTGHSFMKATMRSLDSPFAGELSGHFYFRENYFADSGLIAMVRILSLASRAGKPMSEIVRPLRRYFTTGEINFRVEDQDAMLTRIREEFADFPATLLDGVTIHLEEGWFNLRKSNTEPLIRLNVEGKTREVMESTLAHLQDLLGEPVDPSH